METVKHIYESTKPLVWLFITLFLFAILGTTSCVAQSYKRTEYNKEKNIMTHYFKNKNNVQVAIAFTCYPNEYNSYKDGRFPHWNDRPFVVTINGESRIVSHNLIKRYEKISHTSSRN